MQITQFIDFDSVRVDVSVGTKRQLLNQLAQVAAARLGLDPAIVADSISERERLGSTGFGGGVAIPHGKVAGIEHVYGLVVRLADPVDFKAIDGAPVDLAFLLLSPPDAGAEHLKALAAISRLVRHAPTVEKLRGARSRDAFSAVLMTTDELHAA